MQREVAVSLEMQPPKPGRYGKWTSGKDEFGGTFGARRDSFGQGRCGTSQVQELHGRIKSRKKISTITASVTKNRKRK